MAEEGKGLVAINDPMEKLIASALHIAGVEYEHERAGLDFFLPSFGLYIEVKRFHSDRIADQMARADNIIAVQGEAAVKFLANAIAEGLIL
jgi:hypothetical protein